MLGRHGWDSSWDALEDRLAVSLSGILSKQTSIAASSVQSKYINGEITEKTAIDELVSSSVSEEEARGMVAEWR